MKRLLVLAMAMCWGTLPTLGGLNEAAFSVRVVDELGLPISNATVQAGFYSPSTGLNTFGEELNERFIILADTNGMAHFRGRTSAQGGTSGDIRWGVVKEGYYRLLGMDCEFTNVAAGRLLPWDRVYEVELNKVVNPVPLYARNLVNCWPLVKLPELGKPIGFDLVKSDWISPWGAGEVADFNIQMDISPADEPASYYEQFPNAIRHMNIDFTLTFSNPDDGIQSVFAPPRSGSALRLPRIAPESGYATNLLSCYWFTPERRDDMDHEDQNYFFRVRAKRDQNNNIVGALYGKIHGPIQYTSKGEVQFTYYLNPTPNDRNLEFACGQNLFKKLKSTEQVGAP